MRKHQNENPFRTAGQWYRGNTHTHTTMSDGQLDVRERCQQYADRGYDFLVITDHGVAGPVEPVDVEGLLVIPGAEVHPMNPYGGPLFHVVCINLRDTIDAPRMHVRDVLDEAGRRGALTCLAHPYWTGHTLNDMLPLDGIVAVEVYNETCRTIGRPNSESHWDMLLERGHRVFGIAADDAHYSGEDSFKGWICVKASELTIEAVCDAIARGAFYSSTGPTIEDIEVSPADENGIGSFRIRVRCSPARQVSFVGMPATGSSVYAPEGETITEAERVTTPERREAYVRIEVIDDRGRKAWANPIFLDAV